MSYATQLHLEETLSRTNIRKWMFDEVMQTAVFSDMFIKATDLIDGYLAKDYYKSKQARVDAIKSKATEDIAIELFMAVLPINNGKRTNEPIQGVATNLGLLLGFTHQLDAVKTGAELLAVCEPCGLYKISSAYSTEHDHDTATVIPKFMLSDALLHKIHLTQYMPPMMCEPISWSKDHVPFHVHKYTGGMLTHSSSPVLGHGNDVGQFQCLDALNKLQSIAWTLNETMLREEELPREPLDMSDPIDVRKAHQHNQRVMQSKQVYDLMLANDNHFFFIWKYDKRGRMYSQGYDINLQGSEYKKATIEFAQQEILTGL